ncbi:hypothetical protein GCM10007385_35240 [Tateyamaria omphalii]|uniref:type VI secretion system-associated protein TagO n=1 Tax=Tateyamaria omphalii TaxID=299262 RepID=UPI001674B558|nr:type VI secretion system-associated protein TagO [Tateyamaria omphalii]GGX63063.1 hypothetical protein GCM10007385_35240 [Tateyamaria omphalii]
MKRLIGFGAFALFSGPVWAEECTNIHTDSERLACYDAAAGYVAETAIDTSEDRPEIPRHWSVETSTSALADTTDVFISTSADAATTCRSFGGGSSIPRLFLRCQEDTTSIYVVTNCQMTSGISGYGRVDYRLDKDPAAHTEMTASTSSSALGHWRGAQAIPFIKRMLGKERMLVRFTPFSQNAQEFAFDISGIDEVITPLRESCGW